MTKGTYKQRPLHAWSRNKERLLIVPMDADVTHNEEGGRSREKTVSQSQGCPKCHAHEIGRKRSDTSLPTVAPGQRESKRLASSTGNKETDGRLPGQTK